MIDSRGSSLARLEATLLEARNLPSTRYPRGTSDIIVSVSVEPAATGAGAASASDSAGSNDAPPCGEPATQRSELQRDTLNPVWSTLGTQDRKGQSFVFRPIYQPNAEVVLRVLDHDAVLEQDLLLGVARLPLSSLKDQLKHTGWHELRPEHEAAAGAGGGAGAGAGIAEALGHAKGSVHASVQLLYSQHAYFQRVVTTLNHDVGDSQRKLRAPRDIANFFETVAEFQAAVYPEVTLQERAADVEGHLRL